MHSNLLQLGNILDIEAWQTLQDSLALVTGFAIVTVDYKGIPLTRHSSCRSFCSCVRKHEDLGVLCQKCDSRGGLEAARIERPYVYVCHCNIVDIAIPIIVENQYIGAIMAGQVKLQAPTSEYDLEQIVRSPKERFIRTLALQQHYDAIPQMSLEDLKVRTQMLFDLANYIVKEAMNKNFLLDMYGRMSTGRSALSEVHGTDAIMRIHKELGGALTNAYIESSSQENTKVQNQILQPVFDYLREHRNERLSQQQAAALCHISTGHFSRLFVKETGEAYSNFCARQKIEWAKKLLLRTDLPISQISYELGFNESSYFIKVFRKYEGLSPTAFRKMTVVAPER